jgi:hypothetical protein
VTRLLALKSAVLVCTSAFGASCTDSVVELGVIDNGSGAGISIPATATRQFEAYVYTWGGCVTEESTDVEYVDSETAIVEPLDSRRTDCKIKKLCAVQHQARFLFNTFGEKLIVFRGRNWKDEVIELPTRVLVQ